MERIQFFQLCNAACTTVADVVVGEVTECHDYYTLGNLRHISGGVHRIWGFLTGIITIPAAARRTPYFCICCAHLQENDSNILELLSSQNNEIFLRYFKSNLKELIMRQYADKGMLRTSKLPEDYLVNHISTSFVETVDWWLAQKMQQTPEELTEYFLAVIEPIING